MKNIAAKVTWFQENFPEMVKAMKDSCHHYDPVTGVNPYHQEGDVWTHTMMVCNEARHSSNNVQWAALLHDIGKPRCRKTLDDKGYVAFYSHEPVSAFLALEVLKKANLNIGEILHIFKLISVHTEPFKLTDKQLTERFGDDAQFMFDLKELNRCDNMGRFTDRAAEKKNFIAKSFWELYDRKQTNYYDNEVVMMIGTPCAGKTTLAKERYPEYGRISWDDTMLKMYPSSSYGESFKLADDKKVRKAMTEALGSFLKASKDVVIDMTCMSRKTRRKWLSRFPKHYKRTAIVCITDIPSLMTRNDNRGVSEMKYIERHVFYDMMKRFYPPTHDEFDNISWMLS